jgi:hypothetical protein
MYDIPCVIGCPVPSTAVRNATALSVSQQLSHSMQRMETAAHYINDFRLDLRGALDRAATALANALVQLDSEDSEEEDFQLRVEAQLQLQHYHLPSERAEKVKGVIKSGSSDIDFSL